MNHITIINAFRQGIVREGGNCASVALIKAAIDVFGVNQVFQLTRNEGVYNATLRDNTVVSFTEEELQTTTIRADFHLRTNTDAQINRQYREIFDYANICFCVMVKKVMEIGETGHGIGSFESAIAALNDGATTSSIYRTLGITQTDGPSMFLPTRNRSGVLAWHSKHTVFASHGDYDHRGDVRPILAYYPNRLQIIS